MKISFVLPMYLNSPSGGFKVVYEYANRLQARGHQVSVIHPRNLEPQYEVREFVKNLFWDAKLKLINRPLVSWMDIHPGVKLILVPDLREQFIPDGDVVIATAYQTAFWVNDYSERKGRKFYLIQSYEDWNGPEEEVRKSWLLPLHKVVISKWLMNIAQRFGEDGRTDYIPIGLDLTQFRITSPINERKTPRIGMLAHPNQVKGTDDGIAALEMIRTKLPDLQAVLFGTPPRRQNLPQWATYICQPSREQLVELYNSCQVYLNPSWAEGWGLTAAEAMACGCALVSTSNGGVNEFATNGRSALLAPVKAVDELARQSLRLLLDEKLRRRIARKGGEQVQQFTWDRAVNSIEKLLVEKSVGSC